MKASGNQRFPGLRRALDLTSRRRRIPVIRQLAATDCGASALAMVLEYNGRPAALADLRDTLGSSRDGINAAALLRAGRSYGLNGRGLRVELQDLRSIPAGAILHWEFNHFVVLEGVRADSVDIVDPASGRRRVPMERFRKAFTGVALVFEPVSPPQGRIVDRRSPLRPLTDILRRSPLLARLVLTGLLVQLLTATAPLMLGIIVDRVIPLRDYSLLLALAFVFSLVQLFMVLADFIRLQLLVYFRSQMELRLTVQFIDRLIDLPYSFFQRHTSGDLLVRLRSTTLVRDMLTAGALTTLIDGLMASTYLLLLGTMSLKLTGLVSLMACARIALLLGIRPRQRQLAAERIENSARAQTFDFEMLSAMETLKSMGLEERASARWSDYFGEGLSISIRQGRLDSFFGASLTALDMLSTLGLIFYASLLVIRGELTLGTMLAASALAAGFLGPLNRFATTVLEMQALEVYLAGLNDVMDTAPEQRAVTVVPSEPLKGGIALERVSFRYDKDMSLVIEDVSIRIDPGTVVAIVGVTGSGKSTLARLLAGLYTPTVGRILFDENDLATLDYRTVRSQLGIVTQDTQLFTGSVRFNIALGSPGVGFDGIVRAARMACIHDEITALPMGYETILADRGFSLSGGQRQRLAIARAVARDPRILLLDEATSQLDAISEAAIGDNLARLNCTRIVIAHRLSTVRSADLIVVLQNGRIVESGQHHTLVAAEGAYAKLLGIQMEAGAAARSV